MALLPMPRSSSRFHTHSLLSFTEKVPRSMCIKYLHFITSHSLLRPVSSPPSHCWSYTWKIDQLSLSCHVAWAFFTFCLTWFLCNLILLDTQSIPFPWSVGHGILISLLSSSSFIFLSWTICCHASHFPGWSHPLLWCLQCVHDS